MRLLSKHFPFHTFIAAVLPVAVIILHNFSVIKISYLTAPIVYIIVIGLLCYGLAYYILKQKAGAFLYTSFVLASGFYFYGIIQMGIGLLGSTYVRDVYCFGVWLLLCLAVLIAMRKKFSGQAALKFVPGLNVFAAAFFLVSIAVAYLSYAEAQKVYDPASNNEVKMMKAMPLSDTDKKNVYYILMDECANESTLKRLFAYNSPFNGQLAQLGFFIDRNAFSSYSETFYSMSATLNLEHVDIKNTFSGYYTNNSVDYIYKSMGYQTEAITSYFVKNNGRYKSDIVYDPYQDNMYENEFITSLFSNTAFRVMYKFIFFKKGVKYHAQSLNNSFVLADSVLKTKPPKPRFLYIHINSPHGPLCIDSTGKPDYTYVTGPDNYLQQLIYTEKSVLSLIKKIQKAEKGNCIILVQSDHGIRAHSTPVVVPEKQDMFRVVNAVYFPDSAQHNYFTDSMNIVNNFRMIFNYQFNTKFGKLP